MNLDILQHVIHHIDDRDTMQHIVPLCRELRKYAVKRTKVLPKNCLFVPYAVATKPRSIALIRQHLESVKHIVLIFRERCDPRSLKAPILTGPLCNDLVFMRNLLTEYPHVQVIDAITSLRKFEQGKRSYLTKLYPETINKLSLHFKVSGFGDMVDKAWEKRMENPKQCLLISRRKNVWHYFS